jgi:ubiquinone/menaquinone biosynthesis C-methylase UbiE
MSNFVDQQYLLNEEYKDASHLNARIQFFQRFSINGVDQYRWIFDHFDLRPGSRILELGCGPGFLWQKNLDRIPPDWTITLSDFSPGMIQEAQDNLRDSSPNFSFLVIDAQTIPLETSRFDAVIANNMLYHVPDRQRALSEIHRVLKPDGYFYASTIGEESFSEMNRLMGQNSLALSPWVKRLGFSLENGGEQLSFWFTHLDLHRLENTLMITETEPLLQMMRSGMGDSSVDEETFRHLREGIDQEVTQHGGFRSTMHLGLFVAHGRK